MLENLVEKYGQKISKYDLLAISLMPQELQESNFLLHHFYQEVDQLSKKVSEPMIGEIRMEWWREIFANQVAKDPFSEALMALIDDKNLPTQKFLDFLEAKRFDLYGDPMGTIEAFEAYSGKTIASILQLAQFANDPSLEEISADVSGHLGIAHMVNKVLSQFSYLKSTSKQYVPAEIFMNVAIRPELFFSIKEKSKENELMQEFLVYGIANIEKAREAFLKLSKADQKRIFPIYLPLLQSKYYFINASKAGGQLVEQHPILQYGQFKYQLNLLKDVMFKSSAFKV